jgi:hypothetical protein
VHKALWDSKVRSARLELKARLVLPVTKEFKGFKALKARLGL